MADIPVNRVVMPKKHAVFALYFVFWETDIDVEVADGVLGDSFVEPSQFLALP
jgi:hypothetical protein